MAGMDVAGHDLTGQDRTGAIYGRAPARPPPKRKPHKGAAPKAAGERTLSDLAGTGIPKVSGEKRRNRKSQSGLAKISESAEWELSSSAARGSADADAADEYDDVWAEAGLLEPSAGSAGAAAVGSNATVHEEGADEIEIFMDDGDDDTDDDMAHSGSNAVANIVELSHAPKEHAHQQDEKELSQVIPKAPAAAAPRHHPHHLHMNQPKPEQHASDSREEWSGALKAPSDAAPVHHPHHLHDQKTGEQQQAGDNEAVSLKRAVEGAAEGGDPAPKGEHHVNAHAEAGSDVELGDETVQVFLQDSDDSDEDEMAKPKAQASESRQKGAQRAPPDHRSQNASKTEDADGHMAGWTDLIKAAEPKVMRVVSAAALASKSSGQSSGPGESGRGNSDDAAGSVAGTSRLAKVTRAAEEADSDSSEEEEEEEDEAQGKDDNSHDFERLSSASAPLTDNQVLTGMADKNGHGKGETAAGATTGVSGAAAQAGVAASPPVASGGKPVAEQKAAATPQRAAPDLFAAMGAAVAEVEASAASDEQATAQSRAPRKLPTFEKIKARAVSSPPVASTTQSGHSSSTAPEGDWTCPSCTLINNASSHACNVCDTPRPEAGPKSSPTKAAPEKRGLLEMMDSAVEETEAFDISFDDESDGAGDVRKATGESIPPEVAGLEDKAQATFDRSVDARRAASGMTAQLLSHSNAPTGSAEPPKPKQRILGKADVVDQFLKNGPKEEREEGSAADGSRLSQGSGLGGLRKAYDSGPDIGSSRIEQVVIPNPANRPKAPEETAEEESPQDNLESEWDDVGARTEVMAKEAQENFGKIAAKEDLTTVPVSYKEVYGWILQLEVDYDVLKPFEDHEDGGVRCGCMSSSKPRGSVPGLPVAQNREKDMVLFLKCTDFDFNNIMHFRMLRTIYSRLTRNKSCASIGRHWEVLGFQAGDPRTDLNRSGGVLNIIHLFYFFSHHFEILKAAWLLSQDDEQNFPLACISIAITKMVMDAFLAGQLSSVCKRKQSKGVLETLNQVHTAGLFHFYWQWRHLKRTIRDTEQTYKEVSALLTRKPAKLLEMLAQGVEGERLRQDPGRLEFTNLDFGAAGGSAGAQSSASAKAKAGQRAPSVPKRLKNYHNEGDAAA